MSIWQFTAAVEGFAKRHASEKAQLTPTERDELWEWINSGETVVAKQPKRSFDPAAALPIEAWG